jgi:hypothetical protein
MSNGVNKADQFPLLCCKLGVVRCNLAAEESCQSIPLVQHCTEARP